MTFEHGNDGWRRLPFIEAIYVSLATFNQQFDNVEPAICTCIVKSGVFREVAEVRIHTFAKE